MYPKFAVISAAVGLCAYGVALLVFIGDSKSPLPAVATLVVVSVLLLIVGTYIAFLASDLTAFWLISLGGVVVALATIMQTFTQ